MNRGRKLERPEVRNTMRDDFEFAENFNTVGQSDSTLCS